MTKQKVLVFPEIYQDCGACSALCPEKAISEKAKEIDTVEYSHGRVPQEIEGLWQPVTKAIGR